VALIEYLTEHLSLFELEPNGCEKAPTVKLFIKYQMTEQLVALFIQNQNLLPPEKMRIIGEFEMVTQDLLEVFGRNLEHHIDINQQNFIIDFVGLLKNLFDSLLYESMD
jgi:triphosphoribosyl-dephospho-CoA synthetase